MTITIDLPQVGESIVEGIIGKWLKQPGDAVEKYDPLVEVVTDKVTMELPSPAGGVLTRILVEEGVTVPIGTPIAEMETDEVGPALTERAAPRSADEVSTIGHLVKDVRPVGPTGGGMGEEPPAQQADEHRARYTPAVRRLAMEHDVDLSKIDGTGAGSRITRNDVLKYVDAGGTAAPTPLSTTQLTPAQEAGPEDETVNVTPVRRIIAQNMVKSITEIPHAWSMVEVDVSGLVKYREGMKEGFQRRKGVELTYLPFVIKAVVEALKEHPMFNSTWGGDKIILKRRINISIAVASTEGLMVPVLHDADSLSIAALAGVMQELAGKARRRELTLQDVQGGTFTVNNTGALGSIVSQPIINHPQAAILTTEAIQKRPVVVGDAIAIRSLMNICLSFDHRIVDGSESGAFLQSVKGRLEAMGPDTPIY